MTMMMKIILIMAMMAKMALENLKLMIRIMRNEQTKERTNDDNVNVNAKQLQEATTPGERSIHRPRTGEGDDAKDRNKHLGDFRADDDDAGVWKRTWK